MCLASMHESKIPKNDEWFDVDDLYLYFESQ